jgi:hypothetical protein
MADTADHGNIPLFMFADNCDHPEPPEPDRDWSRDDPAWRANDEWHTDHQMGREGEPICFLTPFGSGCPACTEAARDEEDLPLGEYVTCRVVSAQEDTP